MNGLVKPGRSEAALRERAKILDLENAMRKQIADGVLPDVEPDCTLRHFFVPKSEQFGCFTYGREITMPRGAVIAGKIHKHPHLNIITKGVIAVKTEFGQEVYKAPVTFVSNPGTKRAVFALQDTVWTTIHLTSYGSEEDLDKIEDEVIAPSFEVLDQMIPNKPEPKEIIYEVLP